MHAFSLSEGRFRTLLALIAAGLLWTALPALAEDYRALEGVSGLDSVFDITLGSPRQAVVTFGAVRDVHRSPAVTSLHAAPRTVLVFHGGAVKLISTDRSDFLPQEVEALDKVAALIRQFKADGIRMEVFMYAVNALGVDPATLMPEVERVGNGFISVLGYQRQGYALVAVP